MPTSKQLTRPLAALLAVAVGAVLLASPPETRAAASVIIRGDCNPKAFRPNEPTIVVCEMEVENAGDASVPEARIVFSLAPDLPTPSRFFFFEPGGNPPGLPPPSIELGTLEAGGVRSARAVMLIENTSAGRVGGSAIVMEGAKGTQHAQATMSFDVRADAAAPSRALEVEIITDESSAYGDSTGSAYATISIEVHNRSTQAVRDVVVRHIAPSVPAVTWISTPTEVPGTPPGFPFRPVTPHRTVEWHIPVLEGGESRYFHGLIEKGEPARVTHSVLATAFDALGSDVLAGAVEEWAYAYCSLPQVDCLPPPTPTPTATSAILPATEPTAELSSHAGEFAESSAWSWPAIAFLSGGSVLFLGIGFGFLALRRRA